jgi:hypothetical protein
MACGRTPIAARRSRRFSTRATGTRRNSSFNRAMLGIAGHDVMVEVDLVGLERGELVKLITQGLVEARLDGQRQFDRTLQHFALGQTQPDFRLAILEIPDQRRPAVAQQLGILRGAEHISLLGLFTARPDGQAPVSASGTSHSTGRGCTMRSRKDSGTRRPAPHPTSAGTPAGAGPVAGNKVCPVVVDGTLIHRLSSIVSPALNAEWPAPGIGPQGSLLPRSRSRCRCPAWRASEC